MAIHAEFETNVNRRHPVTQFVRRHGECDFALTITDMTRLIDSLCDIVTAVRGNALPSDRDRVVEALEGDGLSERPPKWMEDFVGAIAKGEPSEKLVSLPNGYPDGENGLINTLLEIDEHVVPLGIDDSGECVQWRIPKLGVLVFWSRESGGDACDAAIRPIGADLNTWLRVQWNRKRRDEPSDARESPS